jgi:hypothetical protein
MRAPEGLRCRARREAVLGQFACKESRGGGSHGKSRGDGYCKRDHRATFAVVVVAQANPWGWPFTDYPIFATTENGEEVRIAPSDLGLNIFQFMRWAREQPPNEPPSDGDNNGPSLRAWIGSTAFGAWLKGTDPTKASQVSAKKPAPPLSQIILSRFEKEYGKRVVRLRVEDNRIIVTKHGMREVPRKVLAEVELPAEHQ